MKFISNPERSTWQALTQRPTADFSSIEPIVDEVFAAVRSNGDAAVRKYSQKFDAYTPDQLMVAAQALANAKGELSAELVAAIDVAYENIYRFHEAQKTAPVRLDTQEGVSCWQEKKPIEKVGIYIPGGTAPLFSTVLMLAIPAQLAGCRQIVLCTPPNKSGVPAAIRYAAQKCGVTLVAQIGGIQAIAALTYGTERIPKVYKIFGPGNQFVTVAKQMATQYQTAIDMPAGPSELLVVADSTAKPAYVAADLLSQAEHGKDSQVILVSTSEQIIPQVQAELDKQLLVLPRKEIAAAALENSLAVYFDDEQAALDFINEYGPEHYITCVENENVFVDGIINAGSVFIGNYTPESAGDYASGTNHTLPTNGYTKQYSGVNLDAFLKAITYQRISAQGIRSLGPHIEAMAAAEGLDAHKNAVSLRLKDLNNG
ncbi:MAG: histidinol dehydrogenase [Flavobacteriaceae bacterium]|jgi:histidinol dehydrogenase